MALSAICLIHVLDRPCWNGTVTQHVLTSVAKGQHTNAAVATSRNGRAPRPDPAPVARASGRQSPVDLVLKMVKGKLFTSVCHGVSGCDAMCRGAPLWGVHSDR
jgi:hypothetical protein